MSTNDIQYIMIMSQINILTWALNTIWIDYDTEKIYNVIVIGQP